MQGFYVSSEGSPEATFLLVENYKPMTALVGLRIGWEFLKNLALTATDSAVALTMAGRCVSCLAAARWSMD